MSGPGSLENAARFAVLVSPVAPAVTNSDGGQNGPNSSARVESYSLEENTAATAMSDSAASASQQGVLSGDDGIAENVMAESTRRNSSNAAASAMSRGGDDASSLRPPPAPIVAHIPPRARAPSLVQPASAPASAPSSQHQLVEQLIAAAANATPAAAGSVNGAGRGSVGSVRLSEDVVAVLARHASGIGSAMTHAGAASSSHASAAGSVGGVGTAAGGSSYRPRAGSAASGGGASVASHGTIGGIATSAGLRNRFPNSSGTVGVGNGNRRGSATGSTLGIGSGALSAAAASAAVQRTPAMSLTAEALTAPLQGREAMTGFPARKASMSGARLAATLLHARGRSGTAALIDENDEADYDEDKDDDEEGDGGSEGGDDDDDDDAATVHSVVSLAASIAGGKKQQQQQTASSANNNSAKSFSVMGRSAAFQGASSMTAAAGAGALSPPSGAAAAGATGKLGATSPPLEGKAPPHSGANNNNNSNNSKQQPPQKQSQQQPRGRRKTRLSRWERLRGWMLSNVFATWNFAIAVLLLSLGIIFQFALPGNVVVENPTYKWLYFFGGSLGFLLPLQVLEQWTFSALERLGNERPQLSDAMDFALSGRGHIAYIIVVVIALLLKSVIFELYFSADREFWFSRSMAALIVLQAGIVVKKAGLKFVLRRVYATKNAKAVRDVIYYEELARTLTAPLPPIRLRRALTSGSAATVGAGAGVGSGGGGAFRAPPLSVSHAAATSIGSRAGPDAQRLVGGPTAAAASPFTMARPVPLQPSVVSQPPATVDSLAGGGGAGRSLAVAVTILPDSDESLPPPVPPRSQAVATTGLSAGGQQPGLEAEVDGVAEANNGPYQFGGDGGGAGAVPVPLQPPPQQQHQTGAAAEIARLDQPPQPTWEGTGTGGIGAASAIRRTHTPTHFLENEGFWRQSYYVRTTPFSVCDEYGLPVAVVASASSGSSGASIGGGEGDDPFYRSEEGALGHGEEGEGLPVADAAAAAFDRLVEHKLLRLAAKAAAVQASAAASAAASSAVGQSYDSDSYLVDGTAGQGFADPLAGLRNLLGLNGGSPAAAAAANSNKTLASVLREFAASPAPQQRITPAPAQSGVGSAAVAASVAASAAGTAAASGAPSALFAQGFTPVDPSAPAPSPASSVATSNQNGSTANTGTSAPSVPAADASSTGVAAPAPAHTSVLATPPEVLHNNVFAGAIAASSEVNPPSSGGDGGGLTISTSEIRLARADLAPCFPRGPSGRRQLDAAFALLDLDGDGAVKR